MLVGMLSNGEHINMVPSPRTLESCGTTRVLEERRNGGQVLWGLEKLRHLFAEKKQQTHSQKAKHKVIQNLALVYTDVIEPIYLKSLGGFQYIPKVSDENQVQWTPCCAPHRDQAGSR